MTRAHWISRFVLVLVACLFGLLAEIGRTATLTVTVAAENGPGSLRQAILDANATPGPDLIEFGISGPGPHRLRLTNGLPDLTAPVLIDGLSQGGSVPNSAMGIHSGVIQIELDGSQLSGGATNGLRIVTSNCVVRGMAIFGFPGHGVRVEGDSNRIAGCFLGLDASGTNAPGNSLNGVEIASGNGNVIGGPAASDRNVISGNGLDGIYLIAGSGHWLAGNLVGTDAGGGAALGNTRGITLLPGSSTNLIGGSEPAAGNWVRGNHQAGLRILSDANRIEGNVIGHETSSPAAPGNGTAGISLGGRGNQVGGPTRGSANTIAGNSAAGVAVLDGDALDNAILGNAIFANGGLGIDLDDNGAVEANDPADDDEGANRLQNHPVLDRVTVTAGGGINLGGSLTSTPATTFRLEFFFSPEADASGHGEGRDWLGAVDVVTGGDGVAAIEWSAAGLGSGPGFVAATATDPSGNTSEFSPALALASAPVTNTTIRINGRPAVGTVTVTNEAEVTLLGPAPSVLRYTLDGSAPGAGAAYGGTFRLRSSAFIRAVALGADGGPGDEATPVNLIVVRAPRLVREPEDVAAVAGGTAVFEAGADGDAPLGFQWRRGGTDLPGATNATLRLMDLAPAQAGDFVVIVTNDVGAATSRVARLTVRLIPGIASGPAGRTVARGENVTFCVTATGTPPLQYQWRHNGLNIPGATNDCYSITNVQLPDGGAYAVVVANESGAVTSDPAVLLVEVTPLAPGDAFTNRVPIVGLTNSVRGTNATFSNEPGEPRHGGKRGGRSAWYSWRAPANGLARFRTVGSGFDTLLGVYRGTAIEALVTVAEDEDSAGFLTSEVRFRCEADADYAIAVDAFAELGGGFVLDWEVEPTAEVLPIILLPPAGRIVAPGSRVELTVTAAGIGLNYQWHLNRRPVPGATSPVLVLPDVQADQIGSYTVTISNSAGRAVTTTPVFVELGLPPRRLSEDKLEDLLDDIGSGNGSGAGLLRPASATCATCTGFGDINTHLFNNVTGGTSANETNHCGVVGNATHWLTVTVTNGGLMAIDTAGSTIPTVLAVYAKVGYGRSDQPVACGVSDVSTNGGVPYVRAMFRATNGTYFIVADGLSGSTGLIQVHWAIGAPPVIPPFNPVQRVVQLDEPAEFITPPAAGTPAPGLQWFQNGLPIQDATNRWLNIPAAGPENEGFYTLRVMNALGQVDVSVGSLFLALPILASARFDFEQDLAAWGILSADRAIQLAAAQGNPGQCLATAAGSTAGTWHWTLPSLSPGDLAAAYGGWLQFDLFEPGPIATNISTPLLSIHGANRSIHFVETSPTAVTVGWQRRRIPLHESPNNSVPGQWHLDTPAGLPPSREEFLEIIDHARTISLRGRAAAFQTARLDNVALLDTRRLHVGFADTDANDILLTWSEGLLPFQLESTATFGDPALWTTNFPIGRVTSNKGLRQVSVPQAGPHRFYRLRRP